jgi:hypothetical protein
VAAKQTKFSVAIPGDLTKAAMARIIQQLMAASDGEEEKSVLDQLEDANETNDLADLAEEKRGAVSKIPINDEDDMPLKGKKA